MDEGFTIKNTFRDTGRGLLIGLAGLAVVALLVLAGLHPFTAFCIVLSVALTGYTIWTIHTGSYPFYVTLGLWTRVYVINRAEMPLRYWLGVALGGAGAVYFALGALGMVPAP
jgi:hypothetical protein